MFDRGWRAVALHRIPLTLAAGLVALGGCGEGTITVNGQPACDVNQGLLTTSLAPNAIPALTLPTMVGASHADADYLVDSDRVVGVVVNGEARAYPHKVFWRHEIVNDQIDGTWVSITYCPLTGSAIGFDPHINAVRLDLGVSGLLFANNLVLYDRFTGGLYGPQLSVVAVCASYSGEELTLVPVQEMSWRQWRVLNPDTEVVSSATPGLRPMVYPYGSYDQVGNNDLLIPMAVDNTRPLKERVLSIRIGDGGRGYPFGELAEVGDVVAINESVGGVPTVIFYEAKFGQAALAFDARVNGQTLTFDGDPGGFWTDRETGSTWALDGTATAGTLMGERLMTRADAYTLFWFAWRHFQPFGTTFES